MHMAVEYLGLEREIRKLLAPAMERLASGAAFEFGYSFPITKVDGASRTVEGVATDESVDAHGEILDYAASKAAFAAWEKNIREMHQPNAVGRAVSVVANDAAKSITIRARISRGSESTWIKILDGTLRAFSVGGTRLRSEVRSDGVRRTSEYRLGEVSLVDVGANPNTKFAISKSLSGRPVVTDVVALDSEADYFACADAVDAVALQLRAGCRPLPQEVQKALYLSGSSVVCDQLAPKDFAANGPQIASDLRACATALRRADNVADLEKARETASLVLLALPCRRDLARSRGRGQGNWSASGRGATVESLREEIAKCIGAARGMGLTDATKELEVGAMKLHTIASRAGGASKALFTKQELVEMRDKLAGQLNDWHAKNLPQNVPEYRRLSDTYFLVLQKLKGS
jgi:hypothetical protein